METDGRRVRSNIFPSMNSGLATNHEKSLDKPVDLRQDEAVNIKRALVKEIAEEKREKNRALALVRKAGKRGRKIGC